MENLNIGARVAICGTIGMPSFPIPLGPRINRTLLIKRAKIEGLLVLDYFNKYSEIYKKSFVIGLNKEKLNHKQDITYGLDTAPSSLVKVLNGSNLGKQLKVYKLIFSNGELIEKANCKEIISYNSQRTS